MKYLLRYFPIAFICLAPQLTPDAARAGDRSFIKHYKAGLEAVAAEDWRSAAQWMQRAIAERGKESRRLPRYAYLKPYLPHFYLGLAQFKRGNCVAARKSWQISEDYGVVQKRPQYQQIAMALEICQQRRRPVSRQQAIAGTPPPPPPRRNDSSPPPPQRRDPEPEKEPPTEPWQDSGSTESHHRYRPAPLDSSAGLTRSASARPAGPPPESLRTAATALLDGSYQQVIDRLSAATPDDAFSRAHSLLLMAAAEFSLYLQGGAQDQELLESARAHVLDVRRLLPDLELSKKFFSPRFIDFYYGQQPSEDR